MERVSMKYKDKIYYQDELNDDPLNFGVEKVPIDGKYKYIHKNIFFKIFRFFVYLIALPIIFVYVKLIKKIKIKNKKVLKKYRKGGYFVYANHTSRFGDAFVPVYTCRPNTAKIIVNSDNVSVPVAGRITRLLGALPLPDTIQAAKNFNKAIDICLKHSNPIVIYPEAHLWPYYTKIRPFGDQSFVYPVKFDKPVFTFTTTYVKKKEGKKPKVVVYVDGPFFPNENLSKKERQKKLRDEVYAKLCERAKLSDYDYLTYIKGEPPTTNAEDKSIKE